MILACLEENLRDNPEKTFLVHRGRTSSFRDTFDASARLAAKLHAHGVRRGDRIALDLPNSPDLVFLLFAGAMLGVSFFSLNHRLTAAKKNELLEGFDVRVTIDEATLDELARASAEPVPADLAREPLDADEPFVRMFTSGSTGVPKAAELTQRNLVEAARSSASYFLKPGGGLWQLVLPMYHVGGLQVVLRSLVNHSAFVLYDAFDRDAILADLVSLSVTHISVVDTILQDLLATAPDLVRTYQAIHLGGGPPNEATLAAAQGSNVYVSYGMTEACATVAARPLHELAAGPGAGGMEPLRGYQVRVLDADETGVGEIAIAGRGVFAGYASRTGSVELQSDVFTADGYFRTGDRGRLEDGLLYVSERLGDLFISGGENVYPREIERALETLHGVRSAAVIGVPDPKWGRRPVAFVTGDDISPAAIDEQLAEALTRFQRPDATFVMDELPRTGPGKIDRRALADLYGHRIEVDSVTLYRISQPLVTPFRTSQAEITERESVIVEIADRAGRRGYAESVAFSTPWYTPETIQSTIEALREHLIPVVLGTTFLHPAEVAPALADLPGNLMAKGAIEPACWDLYGRIRGVSLPELLAEWLRENGYHSVASTEMLRPAAPAGVSLGIMTIEETLEQVRRYVTAGYTRAKLKIRPGDDFDRVSAVRRAHPDLMLMVDANRGYTASDADVFRKLDALSLVCVEEPIRGSIDEIAAFQRQIATPICIDESVITEADLEEALAHPELRNINLKIGKFGGVLRSLQLYRSAAERGIALWLGGMYETGVSKYLHAEFERLAEFTIPGDMSASRRYFERDIVVPEVKVEGGNIVLPDGPGLGFELDRTRIEELLIEKIEVARDGH